MTMKDNSQRFNSILLGMISGIAAPFLTLVVVWMLREEVGFGSFLSQMQSIGMLSKLLSLCVLPNLLFFFVFVWLNKLYSSRGILFATIIYGLLMVILKLA